MTHKAKELGVDELKPRFLDIIENGHASESNPHRVGVFLQSGRRTGRLNPGRYFVLTDKMGKTTWEQNANPGHKLTIIGNLITTEVNKQVEAARQWRPYRGDYVKQYYDIELHTGEIIGQCWPNAGTFHDGEGRVIDGSEVKWFSQARYHMSQAERKQSKGGKDAN